MLINKGKFFNDNGRVKFTPNDRLKRDKVKEEDKVRVIVNERVKRDSVSKVFKANVKVPLNPNRKPNTNTSPLQTHVPKPIKSIEKPSSSIDKPSPKINKKPGIQNNKMQTFAVNYCMCGSSKGKRNTENDEDITDTFNKLSNDFIRAANQPSVRGSKPILSLPTPVSFPQNHNRNKNKPSCPSNCICLNKVPSSKSIDKLLETLMKWKCDLNASNHECPETNCPYGLDSVINVKGSNNNAFIQELVDSMSNAIKSRSLTRLVPPVAQESQNENKNTPSTPITLVSGNINQPMEGNRNLSMLPLTITNTESEYMGAINLEKSNENNCKCTFKSTVDMDVNTDICSIQPRESRRQKRNQDINAVYSTTRPPRNETSEIKGNKYLNTNTRSSSYENKVSGKPDDRSMEGKELYYRPSQIHNRASQVDGSVRLFLDSLKEIVEDKSNTVVNKSTILKNPSSIMEDKSKILDNNSNVVEDKSKTVEDRSVDCHRDQRLNMDQVIKPSLVCPFDCDYEIKFLGVTLRDANEITKKNKIINNEEKQQANFNKFDHSLRKKETIKRQTEEISNIDFGQYFSNVTSKLSLGKLVDNCQYNDNHYRQDPSRLCNINISAFKELIANLNRHDSNQDKALDTKSLAGTIVSKQSACVCCFKDKEEAQNLEVNTFHLLKEHLKQKWDEFRENCQSSCIPPEEENRAFSLLLEKIKQTISEAANQAICKCAEGEPIDGTWNRAYSLLQEYLKNKISRVHCKCPYPAEYNESLVPDVSAKVCILIEKDFQRLKGLCKCLNKSISDKDGLDCSFQLPEKDINIKGKVSKQVSNTSIIITQTASAQVQPNIVMETKSCEVVPEQIELENVVEIINPSSGSKTYIPNTAKIVVSQCINTTVDKPSSQELKYTAPIPSLVNINGLEITKDDDTHNKETSPSAIEVEESQNKHNELSLPLIGYTVDCTCDRYLGSCVCSKATVQNNNRKIEEIWYDVLSTYNKKVNDKNISYVMDNIKSTRSKSVDKMCLHEIPPDICIHHLITIDNVQQVNRDLVDNNTSADNMYMDLMLKYSNDKLKESTHDATNDATNTDAEITSNPESYNNADDSYGEWYEYVPQNIKDTLKSRPARASGQPCVTRRKSETQADNFSKPYLQNCDCSTVPICHVKMLVKNIERKLILSDCTCDSMHSKACPIHSRNNS